MDRARAPRQVGLRDSPAGHARRAEPFRGALRFSEEILYVASSLSYNWAMKNKSLLEITASLYEYIWQGGRCNEVFADAENGPSPDDIREAITPKQAWRSAYSEARKEMAGVPAFSLHPEEMRHLSF